MTAVTWGVLAYVAVQLLVGLLVSGRAKTETDYLLAGRRLGYGLSLFTIFATWFGAETCIGAAGAFYENGVSGGSADPFGYTACLLLMGLVLAAPLWRRGLTTLADLFRERYGAGVERLAVLLMVPTSLLWAGEQVRAFGQVLASSSELAIVEAPRSPPRPSCSTPYAAGCGTTR
jgi:Na+/proline symporter